MIFVFYTVNSCKNTVYVKKYPKTQTRIPNTHTHAQSLQSFKPRHNFVFLLYLLHVRIQGLCGIPPASNYVIWKWLRIKFEYSTKHKHPPLIFPRHQIHIPTWHMWELACVTGGYTVHPWNNSLWIFEYSFS